MRTATSASSATEHQAEASEARRLGGLRRKRESTLQGAYDLLGLETVAGIRRFLEEPDKETKELAPHLL